MYKVTATMFPSLLTDMSTNLEGHHLSSNSSASAATRMPLESRITVQHLSLQTGLMLTACSRRASQRGSSTLTTTPTHAKTSPDTASRRSRRGRSRGRDWTGSSECKRRMRMPWKDSHFSSQLVSFCLSYKKVREVLTCLLRSPARHACAIACLNDQFLWGVV